MTRPAGGNCTANKRSVKKTRAECEKGGGDGEVFNIYTFTR